MQPTFPKLLGALLAALLCSGIALAQSQDSSGQPTAQDPNAAPAPLPPPPQPAAPPAEAKKSKQDVDAVGNRSVGKGINFYSIEREIGLGKSLAQEVERSSKLIDDPIVTEYVNRVGQNLVRNSDAKVPF